MSPADGSHATDIGVSIVGGSDDIPVALLAAGGRFDASIAGEHGAGLRELPNLSVEGIQRGANLLLDQGTHAAHPRQCGRIEPHEVQTFGKLVVFGHDQAPCSALIWTVVFASRQSIF